MAVREIVTVPHPVLRRKAARVTDFGPALQKLIDDMIDTMRDAPGVGLAAPQVNVSQRVIVVEYEDPEEGIPHQLYAVVNPEIVAFSRETETGVEGCLSIPGVIGDVERAQRVEVRGLDRHGKPLRLRLSGWVARIFQHEIDHLNGVLFTDRASRLERVSPERAAELDRV